MITFRATRTAGAAFLVALATFATATQPASAAPAEPVRESAGLTAPAAVAHQQDDTPAWELYRYSQFRVGQGRLRLRFVKISDGSPMGNTRLRLAAETADGTTLRDTTRTDRNGYASWRLPQRNRLVFVRALFRPRRDHYVGDSLCRSRPELRWRECAAG